MTPDIYFENLQGAILVCRAAGECEIVYASKGIAGLFGLDSVDAFLCYVGHSYRRTFYAEDEVTMIQTIWRQIKRTDGRFMVKHRILLPDHSLKTVMQIGRLVKEDGKDDLFYIYLYDIRIQAECEKIQKKTESEETEARRAGKDEVTGFVHRYAFIGRGEELITKIHKAGHDAMVLYIRMVGYGAYGVKHGSSMVNLIVKEVARRLKKEFPHESIGRVEDDAFCMITEATNWTAAMEHLKKKLERIDSKQMISIKSGGYLIEKDDRNYIISDAMDKARSACSSILLVNDVFYRSFSA